MDCVSGNGVCLFVDIFYLKSNLGKILMLAIIFCNCVESATYRVYTAI